VGQWSVSNQLPTNLEAPAHNLHVPNSGGPKTCSIRRCGSSVPTWYMCACSCLGIVLWLPTLIPLVCLRRHESSVERHTVLMLPPGGCCQQVRGKLHLAFWCQVLAPITAVFACFLYLQRGNARSISIEGIRCISRQSTGSALWTSGPSLAAQSDQKPLWGTNLS
jgi:hypothetical protein